MKAVVKPFLAEMDLALGAATAAVSRAGASSLAEIAAMRLPSLLVPFPAAADNHQFFNALAFEKTGAAKLLEQKNSDAGKSRGDPGRTGRKRSRAFTNAVRAGAMARAARRRSRSPKAFCSAIARRTVKKRRQPKSELRLRSRAWRARNTRQLNHDAGNRHFGKSSANRSEHRR